MIGQKPVRFGVAGVLAEDVFGPADPFLAVAVGWTGSGPGWGVSVPIDWWMTADGRESGCTLFNRDADDHWPEDACTTTVDGQRGTVLVLGDQHADSISTGAVAGPAR